MTDYALRCTQQDCAQLIALGVALGVLQIDAETGAVSGAQGSAWDEIGEIEGAPGYWHANQRTEVDLRAAATQAGVPEADLGALIRGGCGRAPRAPGHACARVALRR